MIKLIAIKALPYNKIRMPGDEFEAKPGYAEFFIRSGLARLADDSMPSPKKKRKYTKRAITAAEYETTEMGAD